MRDWRVVAAVVGLAIGSANPAAAWAHAAAHARGAEEEHHHVGSLDGHHGPVEASRSGHADGHQHPRLDAAAPTTKLVPALVLTIPVTAATLDIASGDRAGAVRAASLGPPDPGGGAPPRPRSPPLR